VTRYDEDEMRRPNGAGEGTRHPLAGLPQSMLDAALRGVRQVPDVIGSSDGRDFEDVAESMLITLRASGCLNVAPLFVASPVNYVGDNPESGNVLDLHDWPHSQDITETLFGVASIPWEKAVWAANQLNTDYAVTREAWANHQEKIKEGGS
jgi:hypothetical protein